MAVRVSARALGFFIGRDCEPSRQRQVALTHSPPPFVGALFAPLHRVLLLALPTGEFQRPALFCTLAFLGGPANRRSAIPHLPRCHAPTSRARYGFVKWALLWRPKAPQVQPGQGGGAATSQQEGLNPKEIVRPVRDRFTPWPPSTRQPAPTPGKRCPSPSVARWGSSWPAPRRMKKSGPSGPPAGAAMSGGPL